MASLLEMGRWVYDVFINIMHEVTSADKAYALLKEQGYEWTRAAVRETWKEVGQKDYWATVIETWGTERKPPRAWVIERQSVEAEGYQHILKVEYTNIETGERETAYFSATYDNIRTFEDVEADLAQDISDYAYLWGWAGVEVHPGGIVKYTPKR